MINSVQYSPKIIKQSINLFDCLNNKHGKASSFFNKADKLLKKVSWKEIFEIRSTSTETPFLSSDDLQRLEQVLSRTLTKKKLNKKNKKLATQLDLFLKNNFPKIDKINGLPSEILQCIFSYVQASEMSADPHSTLSLVNKNWHANIQPLRIYSMLDNAIIQATADQKKLKPLNKSIKYILTELSTETQKTYLNDFFTKLPKKPLSTQNHLILTLILNIKEYADLETFKELLAYIYKNPLLTQGNRLHLLRAADDHSRSPPLRSVYSFMRSLNPVSQGSSPGILLAPDSPFVWEFVNEKLFEALEISEQNTFQEREVVAIDDTGNLLVRTNRRLFYGLVLEVMDSPTEHKKYKILLSRSKDKIGSHIEIMDPSLIGKIPNTICNKKLLPDFLVFDQ